MSILGRVADVSLKPLSWRRRSRTVLCTHVDRVLTSHMGSHGRRLMAFFSSDILEDEAGKNLGGCSLAFVSSDILEDEAGKNLGGCSLEER